MLFSSTLDLSTVRKCNGQFRDSYTRCKVTQADSMTALNHVLVLNCSGEKLSVFGVCLIDLTNNILVIEKHISYIVIIFNDTWSELIIQMSTNVENILT